MDAVVQTLVTNLSNGEADLTECGRIYDDVMANLGTMPVLVSYSSGQQTNGLAPLPANAVALLLAFYNNEQLGELSIREADWLFPNWREATGTPFNFVRESIISQAIQLVPTPNDANAPSFLASYTTDTLPVYLQMPVALLVLADEYGRESDHQNIEIANACRELGQLLIGLLMRKQ